MKKFATLAAAAAIAFASVAPVAAEEAKANADPFETVSSQGGFGNNAQLAAASVAIVVLMFLGIDSSDNTTVASPPG